MTAPEVPLLAGRYALGGLLGVGGMAEVREGTDVRLGRRVALKVLRRELARDSSFQVRFRREAQAAASLDAPCIVSVYDTGEDEDGIPFIVMERVDGRTLREVLDAQGRLLPASALGIVADVCGALQVAHAAGIVHRDVKPGNVMLTDAGEVKVMDFGIARAVADSAATMTQTAAVIGTAAYLSPEQARGEHVDARSDVYSAGCLLYELVTGVAPFRGDSPVAVAYQHVREQPVPPREHDPDLSPDVDAVVLTAMAKRAEDRYQSAADMRADLLRAAAGEPVEAVPLLPGAEPVLVLGPGRGRRALVLALFTLLLLAVAAGSALLVRELRGAASEDVAAPALGGLTQQQAVDALAETGLHLGTLTARFAEKPVGTVVAQEPAGGVVVPRGGDVDVVVSKGVDLTAVPDLVGLDRDAAVAALGRDHLGLGRTTSRDGNVPAGQVLETRPAAGSRARPGGAVDLVVASGRAKVPDVRGRGVAEAVALLRKAGLSVAVQPRTDPGPAGLVLAQDPVEAVVDLAAVVTLQVSQAPAPVVSPPPSATPSSSPTASPSPSTSPSRTPSPTPTPSPSGSPSPDL